MRTDRIGQQCWPARSWSLARKPSQTRHARAGKGVNESACPEPFPGELLAAKLSDSPRHFSSGHVRKVCRSLMSLVSQSLRTKLAEGRAGPDEA